MKKADLTPRTRFRLAEITRLKSIDEAEVFTIAIDLLYCSLIPYPDQKSTPQSKPRSRRGGKIIPVSESLRKFLPKDTGNA